MLTIQLFYQIYHFGTIIAKENFFSQLTLFNTKHLEKETNIFIFAPST